MSPVTPRELERLRDTLAGHEVEIPHAWEMAAILQGCPDTTQDADLFVDRDGLGTPAGRGTRRPGPGPAARRQLRLLPGAALPGPVAPRPVVGLARSERAHRGGARDLERLAEGVVAVEMKWRAIHRRSRAEARLSLRGLVQDSGALGNPKNLKSKMMFRSRRCPSSTQWSSVGESSPPARRPAWTLIAPAGSGTIGFLLRSRGGSVRHKTAA